MTDIKKFEGIHTGADIYVIGSGKSLDFIDPVFFENKITVGINQIYKKIRTDYIVRKDGGFIDDTVKRMDDKQVLFVSKGKYGRNNTANINHIQKKFPKNANIVVFDHETNKHSITDLPGANKLVVSHSTITTGIHLAAHMGAKNIILIGHDCGLLDGESNFAGYHTANSVKLEWKNGFADYNRWLPKIEDATIALKGLLKKKYGANVYSLNPFINFGLEGHKYSK